MAEMELDWAALEKVAASGGALPVGDYTCRVEKAEATSTSNGKPMIKVVWAVTAGPQQNRKITHNLTISAESAPALAIVRRQLEAIGVGWPAPGTTMAALAASLVGRSALLNLSQREWPAGSGSMRNDVASIKAIAGTVPAGTPAAAGPPAPGAPSPAAAGPPAPAAMPAAATPAGPPAPTAPAAPAAPPAMPQRAF